MIPLLLFLQLVALIAILREVHKSNIQDFTKEDFQVKETNQKISEAKQRIPK